MFKHIVCKSLVVAASLPGLALAQGSPQGQSSSSLSLEEVVVTAQKVRENLQDVSVAVTALDGSDLANFKITNLNDIAGRVPSLTIQSQSANESEIFIRGIGSTRLVGTSGDPSVGTFLDEVYITRRGAATPPLFDLDRIEVLRGPQGTVFGKNVVGGALSIFSAKPKFEPEGSFYVGVGNYNAIQSGGYYTTSVSDDVAIRVAAYQNKRDGYARNIVFGEDLEDLDGYAGRFSLAWKINDQATLDVIVDASSEESNGQSRHMVDDPTQPGPGFAAPNLRSQNPRINESPYDQYANKDTFGLTARLAWDLGPVDLTYLSALRTGDAKVRWGQIGTTSPPASTDSVLTIPEDNTAITQEIRLTSPQDERFRWMAGLYFLDDDTEISIRNTAASGIGGNPVFDFLRDRLSGDWRISQEGGSKNYAAFASASYDIVDSFTLSLGGRITRDEKDVASEAVILSLGPPGDIYPVSPINFPYAVKVSESWTEFTPRVALDWRYREGQLAYATASKGFKGGGWQAVAATPELASTPYEPETAWTYELGWKSEWLDRRLRLNVAAYYTDFKDLQVELLDDVNLVLVIDNASDAEIKGVEVEVEARLMEGLTAYAWGSLIDSEYKDYVDVFGVSDYSGNRLQRTPEEQFNAGFDLNLPISNDLEFFGNLNYFYQGQFYYGPENTNEEPSYGLLDMRIGIGSAAGKWNVAVYGKNVTDELYRVSIIPFLGDESSSYGAPRTYGLTFTKAF
jgi:iron complex outermembrane recepter protein